MVKKMPIIRVFLAQTGPWERDYTHDSIVGVRTVKAESVFASFDRNRCIFLVFLTI